MGFVRSGLVNRGFILRFIQLQKIDYKKVLGKYYKASAKKVVEVQVPAMNFLMVDGNGAPDTKKYREAVEALYSVSYTLKFMIKKSDAEVDYGVMPLEGLWWADDMSDFVNDNKSSWIWTMMIMQPECVTKERVQIAVTQVKDKKNLPAIDKVRFQSFSEGKCAQTLHLGPFSEEGPTVDRVHAFIGGRGSEIVGRHHEIYLSDIRRAAPENWKTVIRQPMS